MSIAAPAPPPLLIRNGLLCDGRAAPVAGTLVIRDGRIAAIVGADADAPAPGEDTPFEAIDARGMLVTPGLIDAHTHLLLSGDLQTPMAYERELIRDSLPLRTLRGAANARAMLADGFTTVRDVCTEGAGYADVALAAAIERGWCDGPAVVPSGPGLGITGGYVPGGVAPGVCIPTGCAICDGADAARQEVRTQVAHGVAWIKVFADWACTAASGGPAVVRPTFTRVELEAIVDEAGRRGRRVAAHVTSDAGARHAIECGVASLEHLGPLSAETLDAAAARGIPIVPTLSVLEHMVEVATEGRPRDEARRRFDAAAAAFERALAAGVRIVCGTDIGCYPFARGARGELQLYARLGMAPLAALRTATSEAAALLALPDVGVLAAGAIADLCLWHEATDLAATLARPPALVIRRGRPSGPARPRLT